MKNNSFFTVISLLFVLFVLGSSCGPEPPPPPPPIIIPTFVTDIDGNTYRVKRFKNTLWMRDNLRVTRYDTESSGNGNTIVEATTEQSVNINKPYYQDIRDFNESPYTDNFTEEIRNSLGLLYNWSAAAGTVENNATVGNRVQGICPNGWYLPTSNDIDSLVCYLGDNDTVGYKLKSEYGWYTDSGSGSNESGMNCYPAGLAAGNITVSFVGRQAMFWSSTTQSGDNNRARVLQLMYDTDDANVTNINKFQASSVRCVWYVPIEEN